MKTKVIVISALVLATISAHGAWDELMRKATVAKAYTNATGEVFHYRWHEPKTPPATGVKLPLVILMHGAGERGKDNISQLVHGGPAIVKWFQEHNEEYYLLAGQVPFEKRWVEVNWGSTSHLLPETPSLAMGLQIELLEKIRQMESVDIDRIYVTGVSMGGYGTWDLLSRRPDWFAAAMPLCGGVDIHQLPRLIDIPIWIHHGSQDGLVPTVRSRIATAALQALGSRTVRYTEYQGVGHDCWGRAYKDPQTLDWLFAQKRAPKRRVAPPEAVIRAELIERAFLEPTAHLLGATEAQ